MPRPAPKPKSRRRRRPSILTSVLGSLTALALMLTLVPVALLRVVPPPTTAFMLASPTQPVRYHWVPAERISRHARRAVVASEDQKFYSHHGFDLEAIQKAAEHNRRSTKRRGASTISQQTAKNLFLWSGGGYFRKALEAGYTVLIEWLWPKQRILEVYLNIAEFGPGIYGIEAAARHYYGHSAKTLSASEAAQLAAILPSPRRWRVHDAGPYVEARSQWILRQIGRGAAAQSGIAGAAVDPEPEIPAALLRRMEAEEAQRDTALEPLDNGGMDPPPQPGVPEPESDAVPAEPQGPAAASGS